MFLDYLKRKGLRGLKFIMRLNYCLLMDGVINMVLFELEEGFFFEKMKDFFFEEFFGMVIKVEIGVRKFYESFVERIDI